MNTTQESKGGSSIFIGRWTPKVLFSLEERPYRHGQLRRQLGSVFTTNAHQDASQSRIRGLNRPACDEIESRCCGVLVDAPGKDHHRSTRRHVPLGKTLPQERERRSATSRNRNRIKAESFVGTYLPQEVQHRKDDSMNIENKTILITGANRGIGRALVTTVRD